MAKKIDVGKGRGTVNYDKWKAMGYLEGIDEATGEAIADYLEAGQTNFILKIDIDVGVATSGQGLITYDKQEILYETIVAFYQEKKDPDLVIDYDDMYTEVNNALSQRCLKMFDADQVDADGNPYFDSTNYYAFKDWFLNAYVQKTGGKGK